MDLLSLITAPLGVVYYYIIPFLVVLTVVVFFHELGHFQVARWCGISIETFSIGFGREIFGFFDRHGTRWKFSWIPLGGYVKFMGDENAASAPDKKKLDEMPEGARAGSFHHASLPVRTAVVSAGPIANFLLAITIFTLMFMIYGRQITAPVVDRILPQSAAAAAGFQVGDVVLKIDGKAIETFSDMQRIVSVAAEQQLKFLLQRKSEQIALTATPRRHEVKDRFGNIHKIGVLGISRDTGAGNIKTERYGPAGALSLAVKETWFVVERTGVFIYGLILGKEDVRQLGGPIKIAQLSGQIAKISIQGLINFIALISVSIGLINLFPIPMLDGGHLLYYGIEALRGKPLSDRAQDLGFRVGIALVIMLMIFVTWVDLTNLPDFF